MSLLFTQFLYIFLFFSGDIVCLQLSFLPCRQIDGLAPTFLKKPSIRQEDDGKRLLFECRIQADPAPTVIWSHSGVQVKEDKRHKVSFRPACYTRGLGLPDGLRMSG